MLKLQTVPIMDKYYNILNFMKRLPPHFLFLIHLKSHVQIYVRTFFSSIVILSLEEVQGPGKDSGESNTRERKPGKDI